MIFAKKEKKKDSLAKRPNIAQIIIINYILCSINVTNRLDVIKHLQEAMFQCLCGVSVTSYHKTTTLLLSW